jgi:hypothetical protein
VRSRAALGARRNLPGAKLVALGHALPEPAAIGADNVLDDDVVLVALVSVELAAGDVAALALD